MKIKYVGFESSEQEQEVKKLLKKFKSMIPKDVKKLIVHSWDAQDPDNGAYAAVSPDTKYFEPTLHIYNKFFAQSKNEKYLTIIHELTHLKTAIYFSFVMDEIMAYVEAQNADLAVYMRKQLTRCEENLVSNVSYFILEHVCGERN